jgi:hypothetical protein
MRKNLTPNPSPEREGFPNRLPSEGFELVNSPFEGGRGMFFKAFAGADLQSVPL